MVSPLGKKELYLNLKIYSFEEGRDSTVGKTVRRQATALISFQVCVASN
jgi:predicted HTH domain antitoxin